jgi:hypothetical protein
MGSGGTGAGGSNSGPIGSSGPRAGLGSPGAQGQVGNYSGGSSGGGDVRGYTTPTANTNYYRAPTGYRVEFRQGEPVYVKISTSQPTVATRTGSTYASSRG